MIIEGHAGTVGELVSEAIRIARIMTPDYKKAEELWYRGQGAFWQPLLPKLYQPAIEDLGYDERSLFRRFRALATPISGRIPSDEWEWYFLGRHHELPSRLLDWSESLLTAALFALYGHIPDTRPKLEDLVNRRPDKPRFDRESPVVWILDAGSLNKATRGRDAVFTPGGRRTAGYIPDDLARKHKDNALPIAILPARANDRIVAQQGMFTLHGHKKVSIDALARRHRPLKLARIQIDRARAAHLWAELQLTGLSPFSLFPDLDHVAKHVCWLYQCAPAVLSPPKRKLMIRKEAEGTMARSKKKGPKKPITKSR